MEANYEQHAKCPKCGYYDFESEDGEGHCGACGCEIGYCEKCHSLGEVQDIPMMGYTVSLCRGCAKVAYHSGEAV